MCQSIVSSHYEYIYERIFLRIIIFCINSFIIINFSYSHSFIRSFIHLPYPVTRSFFHTFTHSFMESFAIYSSFIRLLLVFCTINQFAIYLSFICSPSIIALVGIKKAIFCHSFIFPSMFSVV